MRTMRPIPIPADDPVRFNEVIQLDFVEAGTFTPISDLKAFTPPLKAGHYLKGLDQTPYRADKKEHFLKYEFIPDCGPGKKTMNTIHVSGTDETELRKPIRIQIPGIADVYLKYGDRITLEFLECGEFHDKDPDSFCPHLPCGPVSQGDTCAVYAADHSDHKDGYRFTSKGEGTRTSKTIHIGNTGDEQMK